MLELENCEFRNFFYEFDSFINLASRGSHVKLKSTTFSRFSNCGSIIKNKRIYPVQASGSEYKPYNFVKNNLENTLYPPTLAAAFPGCSMTSIPYCFIINVEGSKFERFGFGKEKITEMYMVPSTYGMQFHGLILHLVDFKGQLEIKDSSFLNNQVKAKDCFSLSGYTITSYGESSDRTKQV